MINKVLIAALALGFMTPTYAQFFKLTYNEAPGMNPVMVEQLRAEIKKIETDINKDLPNASSPHRLMQGMANSSVMAGKGIGSDYASHMDVFLIGAGIGAAADMAKDPTTDSDLSGLGVQSGLIVGTNLGWLPVNKILGLEARRLNVYANAMSFNTERKFDDSNVGKVDMKSFGFHASYDWIKPSGTKLFGWGGVKIHTGYEYNSTKLRVDSKISENLNYDPAPGTNYNSNIEASPFASIDASTSSIPLEISSSVRMLYILSLYGGLGADFNLGSATGKGDLNSAPSPVNCTSSVPGSCIGGSAGEIVTEANIDGKGKVNPFLFRGFAGLQLNLPFIRIYGQLDKAFGNDLVGATAGVRFVY